MLDALGRLQNTVFISWRMNEYKKEVKQLQPALEALGIRTIVVDEAPGGDLLRTVKTGMHDAHMFIIMGTKGYGTKTSGKIDTWVEMHDIDIKESGKPSFLINMNPEKSLKRFKVGKTNELFSLDTVAWHRWVVGKAMNGKLPQQIMQKLELLKHMPPLVDNFQAAGEEKARHASMGSGSMGSGSMGSGSRGSGSSSSRQYPPNRFDPETGEPLNPHDPSDRFDPETGKLLIRNDALVYGSPGEVGVLRCLADSESPSPKKKQPGAWTPCACGARRGLVRSF
jgi:hypothetical protein